MDLFYFTWGVWCNICLEGANTVQPAIAVLCALHHLPQWNVCTVKCTRTQNTSMGTVRGMYKNTYEYKAAGLCLAKDVIQTF